MRGTEITNSWNTKLHETSMGKVDKHESPWKLISGKNGNEIGKMSYKATCIFTWGQRR